MLPAVKQQIVAALESALAAAGVARPYPPIVLERPKTAAHGDLACNIAMQLARPLKKNPRELAQGIITALLENAEAANFIESAEIAGPRRFVHAIWSVRLNERGCSPLSHHAGGRLRGAPSPQSLRHEDHQRDHHRQHESEYHRSHQPAHDLLAITTALLQRRNARRDLG